MTRKDYVLLAGALKESRPIWDVADERLDQWQETVRAIVYALETDNPRFDYDKFCAACGLED